MTGKCGKRARPDVLYEGSAEEDDDDDGDDGEAVKQLSFHVIMIVWVEMMLEHSFSLDDFGTSKIMGLNCNFCK